jgi:hypothetical protein
MGATGSTHRRSVYRILVAKHQAETTMKT